YAPDRQPGGSSGGTAVAVATEMGVAGIGEDTAGSIRVPAAFNSLVGIRQTVGLVSRTGLIPISPSRDTAGPITRTVTDAAIVLDVIAGYDPADPSTAASVRKIPETYTAFLNKDGLGGARIGIVRELFGTETDSSAAVNGVINTAIEKMRSLGAAVVDPVEVPHLADITNREKYVFEGQAEWQPAFNEFLRWAGDAAPIKSFRELAESGKVGAHVIKMVTDALQAAPPQEDISYLKTLSFAQKLAETGIHQVMAEHNLDALVYPAVKEPPALIGETQTGTVTTGLGARARFPSIVVPAGFTDEGLPVCIEFLARAFEEPRLIELAYSFEQQTHYRRPPEVG
ncbi:MAG: amidase family protein, partial [Dehalococcoidales bacterium]